MSRKLVRIVLVHVLRWTSFTTAGVLAWLVDDISRRVGRIIAWQPIVVWKCLRGKWFSGKQLNKKTVETVFVRLQNVFIYDNFYHINPLLYKAPHRALAIQLLVCLAAIYKSSPAYKNSAFQKRKRDEVTIKLREFGHWQTWIASISY